MNKKDYDRYRSFITHLRHSLLISPSLNWVVSVVSDMRLADGTLFPLPITLDVSEKKVITPLQLHLYHYRIYHITIQIGKGIREGR
jgi:hypothetical protein